MYWSQKAFGKISRKKDHWVHIFQWYQRCYHDNGHVVCIDRMLLFCVHFYAALIQSIWRKKTHTHILCIDISGYFFAHRARYNNGSTVKKVQTNNPFVMSAVNNELFRFTWTFSVITSFTIVIKSHFSKHIMFWDSIALTCSDFIWVVVLFAWFLYTIKANKKTETVQLIDQIELKRIDIFNSNH